MFNLVGLDPLFATLIAHAEMSPILRYRRGHDVTLDMPDETILGTLSGR